MSANDLTLQEKCRLVGGASSWRTHPIQPVGIPSIVMSDGPNGVRGESTGATRTPGVVVPCGIALGATWDPKLVGEIGSLLGVEARRKGAQVLLAPTVNLHRTPIGGRVFESYSEDPELTARLAVAFVRGVQSHDVAVAVKHFVANDSEVDRFTVDSRVPLRALRELYLRPFEAVVREASAWGVMTAYNKLEGEHCAGNRQLLTSILRDEWGFDGVVVSDWFGSHDTVASANGGLSIAMPGPHTIYGDKLVDAVKNGLVAESAVDALVEDILRLIARTHAADRPDDFVEQSVDDLRERDLCRRAVTDGIVLLRNQDAMLPLSPAARVAIIGPNAAMTRIMGGGSASLEPLPYRSILRALEDSLDTPPVFEPGVRIDRLLPPLRSSVLRTPDSEPGLLVEYFNGFDTEAPVIASDVARSTMVRLFGSTPPNVDASAFTVVARGSFIPEVDGPHEFSAVITGGGRVSVGATTVLDDPDRTLPRSTLFFGNASEEHSATIDCVGGEPVPIEISSTGRAGFCGIRLGARALDPPDLMDRAVVAARDADVAVVVVGTNDEWETEGEDRSSIGLPGEQDELIRRVAAANPNTVVIVNAGSPVAMPWADDVAAIVLAYFGGIETGPGLTDVLLGVADPGGRLPTTYPRRLEDTPAWASYAPVDGVQTYREGMQMGYRGFEALGVEPLFPFGHGLSYGTSNWGPATLSSDSIAEGEPVTVSLTIENTGDRAVTEVVQVYIAARGDTPMKLSAFQKLSVEPGDSAAVTMVVRADAFRRWDETASKWVVDPGDCELLVARSAIDVADRLRVTVK